LALQVVLENMLNDATEATDMRYINPGKHLLLLDCNKLLPNFGGFNQVIDEYGMVQASSPPGVRPLLRQRGGVVRMPRMSALPTWLNQPLRSAPAFLLLHCTYCCTACLVSQPGL